MDALVDVIASWHRILLAYALVVGIEGPFLLFMASVKRRPWYEHALAALPTLACLWYLTAARGVQGTYGYWQSYMRFMRQDEPPGAGARALIDLSAAAAGVARLGWTVFGVTAALLVLGWALVIHWQVHAAPSPAENRFLAWVRHAWSARRRWWRSPVAAAQHLAGDSGDVEFTIEPIAPTTERDRP